MSEQQLRSYRLTSMDEPTDEMLHAIMEKVAIAARRSTERAAAIHRQRLAEISAARKAIAKVEAEKAAAISALAAEKDQASFFIVK